MTSKPKARVLILEDEPKIGLSVQKGLEMKGFSAEWYGDSEKGLAHILSTKSPYDLIMLDLMMPHVGGWTVTKTVREAGVMTPILILTARGETEFKTELLWAGADDYLVKPFSFAELVARAEALMRRPQEVLPATLTAGKMELDTVRRTAKFNGEQIAVTPREFSLLELFLRHPGETLTRIQLLEHAFPRESGSASVLDVHMKNLRKKFGEGVFSTVRGVGYRINLY